MKLSKCSPRDIEVFFPIVLFSKPQTLVTDQKTVHGTVELSCHSVARGFAFSAKRVTCVAVDFSGLIASLPNLYVTRLRNFHLNCTMHALIIKGHVIALNNYSSHLFLLIQNETIFLLYYEEA